MKQLLDKLPPGVLPAGMQISTPVVVSALAVGVSAYVATVSIGSLFGAAISTSVSEEESDPLAALSEDSSAYFAMSQKRFDGRSMYVLPPPPRPPAPPAPPPGPPAPPPPPPGPPPPPASYTGPSPTGIVGDEVLFGELRIPLGETKNGITVLAIDAPFTVKLGHMRGEYQVPLWPRLDQRFLSGAVALGRASGVTETAGAADGANGAGGSASGRAAGSGSAGSGSPAQPGDPRNPARPPNPNGNPTTAPVGPGDEPGDDQPSGPGPEDNDGGSSPAMQPVTLPNPNEEPEEPSESSEGIEYVDRAQLPQPLPDASIAAMSREAAQAALSAIQRTETWVVDDHSRARMNHERELLIARLNRNP